MEIIDLNWQKEMVKCTQDIEHMFETEHADKHRLTHSDTCGYTHMHVCICTHNIHTHIHICIYIKHTMVMIGVPSLAQGHG
jgi:hypothetical protein